ncbi:hypothetical protein C2W64_04152 [Brevibacillus laterosporus]|nr:ATP-grasp domain-containing protein [Brevibacillus laterosporus]RAP29205.1 hypothetical protein C2W64_04152 [Brevibacillus laterosporus]
MLTAVPRKKVEGRIRLLEANKDLLQIAQVVAQTCNLPYLYNIQVIYQDGIPHLLKLNPRAFGGLYLSCLSGVAFPYLAINLLLTGEADVPVLI